jgi:hypothetical protein
VIMKCTKGFYRGQMRACTQWQFDLSSINDDERSSKGTHTIEIGSYKTYKVRTKFDKEGEKRRTKAGEKQEKTITVPTLLKLACKNISGGSQEGSLKVGLDQKSPLQAALNISPVVHQGHQHSGGLCRTLWGM